MDRLLNKEAQDSFDATANLQSPEAVSQMHAEGFRRRQEVFWPRFLRNVAPPAVVLDVGSGSGGYTAILSEKGYRVVGLDFSFLTLRETKKRQRLSQLVCGDLSQIPFQSKFADAALVFGVMEFVTDVDTALYELHRVMKPDGLVFFIMLSSRSMHYRLGLKQAAVGYSNPARFSPREECIRLQNKGFSVEKLTPIFIAPSPWRPFALLLQALCKWRIRCWPLAHAFMIECKAHCPASSDQ